MVNEKAGKMSSRRMIRGVHLKDFVSGAFK